MTTPPPRPTDCDWGHCNEPAVAMRDVSGFPAEELPPEWKPVLLPVCRAHIDHRYDDSTGGCKAPGCDQGWPCDVEMAARTGPVPPGGRW